MATTYHTVKTANVVNVDDDLAARRAIDACTFLTPQTERDIDLALGIGSQRVAYLEVTKRIIEDELLHEVEGVDIMDSAGPDDAALQEIEAE